MTASYPLGFQAEAASLVAARCVPVISAPLVFLAPAELATYSASFLDAREGQGAADVYRGKARLAGKFENKRRGAKRHGKADSFVKELESGYTCRTRATT